MKEFISINGNFDDASIYEHNFPIKKNQLSIELSVL